MPWELPRDLDTPALVVDLDTLEANVASMAADLGARGVALRPHAKTHKSLEVARCQRAAGARGLTVATLGEAEVFVEGGFDDIFVAYPVAATGPKAPRLRALAERAHLRVGVDSVDGAALVGRAAGLRSGLEVLIELDAGHHRSGVTPAHAPAIAEAAADAGLRVVGVFTHPGHVYAEPGAAARAAADEEDALAEGARALAHAGVEVQVRSGGSTPTARHAAAAPDGGDTGDAPVVEQRPGSYVFNDRVQVALGSCAPGDVALVVATTVVSLAQPGHVVVDAGSKALSPERVGFLAGFGEVPGWDAPGGGPVVVQRLSEHHGIVEAPARRPAVGDVVAVVPNHVCPVVDHFDRYVVVRHGRVVDRWPVDARGRLR
jgi:D-serine deaminase-like pyridoxal phosphate-dependent protein